MVARATVLIRGRVLCCTVLAFSVAPPAAALEAQKIVAVWQEYVTICGGAMQNPGQYHDSPVTRFGVSPTNVDTWYSSVDGQMVDFFAQTHSDLVGGALLVGLVSARTDTLIEQSCEVALEEVAGNPEAFKRNLEATFAGSPFRLQGGDPVNRLTGQVDDPDLDSFLSFVTQGAFPGYNVVTTLSYLPGVFTIEHLILLAAGP